LSAIGGLPIVGFCVANRAVETHEALEVVLVEFADPAFSPTNHLVGELTFLIQELCYPILNCSFGE
jgi:hypothetical protein